MKSKPDAQRQTDPEQSKRFVEAAQQAGIDEESDAAFERAFRTIARPVERKPKVRKKNEPKRG
jgi:hypothetical protein